MDDKEKERLILVEKQTEINTKKLDDHDKQIDELRKTYSMIETLTLRMGNVEETVKSINNKLDEHGRRIEEEDKKEIKGKADILDYIFKGILTILLGFLAYKIGLK